MLAILLAVFVGQAAPEPQPPRVIRLPSSTVVDGVQCEQWERYTAADGDLVWRANAPASIDTDSGTYRVKPGDVHSDSSPDLWLTLDLTCGPEYAAGIWDGE